MYSDSSRKLTCTSPNVISVSGESASAVFDTAIKLAGIFHIIEWIRTTILLTVIFIGVNLM